MAPVPPSRTGRSPQAPDLRPVRAPRCLPMSIPTNAGATLAIESPVTSPIGPVRHLVAPQSTSERTALPNLRSEAYVRTTQPRSPHEPAASPPRRAEAGPPGTARHRAGGPLGLVARRQLAGGDAEAGDA